MPYLIIAHDHSGMDAKREELREAHRAHLAAQGTKLLVSGALLGGDSNKIEGGASLLDTEDFDEAVRFEAQDPYAKSNGDYGGGSVNSKQRATIHLVIRATASAMGKLG
jgi:uncharacterized protein YciI